MLGLKGVESVGKKIRLAVEERLEASVSSLMSPPIFRTKVKRVRIVEKEVSRMPFSCPFPVDIE